MARFLAAIAATVLMASLACAEGKRTFYEPKMGEYRIDYCYQWATKCGQHAADVFCREQGYRRAAAFKAKEDIGATHPTLVVGENEICDKAFCDGFRFITCE